MCTSCWLFHRNCPSAATSVSNSHNSSSTSMSHCGGLPGGKPFRAKCHFCPSTFQGITSSGFCRTRLANLLKPAIAESKKLPEPGRVDLVEGVHLELHFLERPAQVLALHARLVAVDRQIGNVVERFELQLRDQLVALERVLRDAKFQLQQPFLAGQRVHEPAVGLGGRGDLDHGPRVPVRLAEMAASRQSCRRPRSRFVRPSGKAAPCGPRGRSCASAGHRLPRAFGASLPTSAMSRSPCCSDSCGCEVVKLALHSRAVGQRFDQGLAGVRARRAGSSAAAALAAGCLRRGSWSWPCRLPVERTARHRPRCRRACRWPPRIRRLRRLRVPCR